MLRVGVLPFFGAPLLAIEPVCMGMGDDHCEWDIRPPEQHGNKAKPYIQALQQFWQPPTS